MKLAGKHIGLGITGSFCTYETLYIEVEKLIHEGAEVYPIFSKNAGSIDTRFGKATDFIERLEALCKRKSIMTIEDAEPIGPKDLFDILLIAPCTGNTIGKLANAITDSPVLMAAKAHLRNLKPLVIYLSTNDALSLNFTNIGTLYNSKNIYFVPFGQDNYLLKPNSMVSHPELIIPTLEMALEKKQLQPVIYSYKT